MCKNEKYNVKKTLWKFFEDWLLTEYILAEGNKKVILCERGVSVAYIDLHLDFFGFTSNTAVKELSHLPIVQIHHVQLSGHHGGIYDFVSIASGCDGILIEVHPDPKNAAVDPLQP